MTQTYLCDHRLMLSSTIETEMLGCSLYFGQLLGEPDTVGQKSLVL